MWQGLTFTEDCEHYVLANIQNHSLDLLAWGHTSREEVLSGKLNPLEVYIACKILTERAVWEFAAANPQVDISTSRVENLF